MQTRRRSRGSPSSRLHARAPRACGSRSRSSRLSPAPVDGELKDAVRSTAEVLRALGHEVREQDPSWGFQLSAFLPRYLAGIHEDALAMPHPERLERRTRMLARCGRLLNGRALRRAITTEAKHARRLGRIFEEFDVLMTPTLAQLPVRAGRWDGRGVPATMNGVSRYVPFTTPWNLTGQPAASVPAGFTGTGLPLSVQLVGRPADETTLISLAAELEAERPWADRRPPVS